MQTLRSAIACGLAFLIFSEAALAGLGSRKAAYVGGTWTALKEGAEGKLDTSDGAVAVFMVDGKKGPRLAIPYDKITTLEYGQKAGRRVGATIALGVTTLGLGALPVLFSKKRKHYLTIGYTGEDGKPAGVVFELGKDITRPTLVVFETRSQKKVEYESDEARKYAGN